MYHQKYHIENVLNKLTVNTSPAQRLKIYLVFNIIDKVMDDVNNGRKRMISIKYILKKIFTMMDIPHDELKVTKYNKTRNFYIKKRVETSI